MMPARDQPLTQPSMCSHASETKQSVVNGDAKGAKGTVTGKHGGIEHVLVDFPTEILEELLPGDRILMKAFGVGLKLVDFPEIKLSI